jgi:addiction module RelB/DinJ family antitoxin
LTIYIFNIYLVYMNTASILIKTDPQLKEKAQKTAEEMGISLTSVINRYLKHFIQTKSITFTTDEEIPNQQMIDSLKQSEKDYKAGRFISFKSKKDVLSYLDKEILNEKKLKTS